MLSISGVGPAIFDRLVVGAVGEIEAAQPVIGGGEPDPGFEIARMLLDGAAEVLFGQAEIGGAELLLAEAEIVVRDPCRAIPWERRRAAVGHGRRCPVASAATSVPGGWAWVVLSDF